MPRTRPLPVGIEPSVLKWLIESSGWTPEEIAKRLKTSPQNVHKMLSGEKKPTFRQLQELANTFKRPVAAFLLSKPKQEKPKPKDYRMLPDRADTFDKKTLLVLRESRRLQGLSRELSRNINYDTKTKLELATVTASPETFAEKYRQLFDLTEDNQRRFKTSYELFHYLRSILEGINIYVFQFSMSVEDARGFVFVDEFPFTLVVNAKDSIEARLFTLMHEFAHILLGESAIDLPDATSTTRNSIESWCNRFSAAFLLPKPLAYAIFNENKATLTERKTLDYLSRKYKVSKAMLLTSMRKLQYITQQDYENKLNQFKPGLVSEKQKGAEGRGGMPVEVRTISKVGNKFVSLVADNYDKEFITYTDALNYLSIKSKNFDKVLAKAKNDFKPVYH